MRDETRDRHAGATPHGRSDGGVLATGSSAPCEAAVDHRDRPATAALSMLAMTATLPRVGAAHSVPPPVQARSNTALASTAPSSRCGPARSIDCAGADARRVGVPPNESLPQERARPPIDHRPARTHARQMSARPSASDERRRRTRREYRAAVSADAARRHGIRAVRAGAAAGTERRRGWRGTDAEGAGFAFGDATRAAPF